jgi:DNA replication protein DnaC
MNEQLITQLKQLQLTGIVSALKQQQNSDYQSLDFDTRLSFLLETEIIRRKNNRISVKLKNSNLKMAACFQDIAYLNDRNLDKKQLLELQTFNWVSSNQNLIITGATGVGKTYVASSFINSFCRNDIKAKYYKASELISQFSLARATNKYYDLLVKLSKIPLLVIDEWLREELTQQTSRDLLDLFDERYGKASIIFCSQFPVTSWNAMIVDPTCSDAIMDRIVHNSMRINLQGNSMRQKNASQINLNL